MLTVIRVPSVEVVSGNKSIGITEDGVNRIF